VTEKTINDPKYQWNYAEKERLRECMKIRRDSYLKLPIGQFSDKRYLINKSTEQKTRSSTQRTHSVTKNVNNENKSISSRHSTRNNTPNENETNLVLEEPETIEPEVECSNKMFNRKNVKIQFSVKPPDSVVYDKQLKQELVIELLSSLYDVGGVRYQPNSHKTAIRIKMNATTVATAFKYMQIDDALDIFRYPNRAIQMINLNLQYLDMLNYTKIFTDITYHSKKKNFTKFIESNTPAYLWLKDLTDDDETYVPKSSIRIIEDKVKSMIRNKRDATKKKLDNNPYFNWQHMCNTINLVEKTTLSRDKKSEARLMIQLYTRELVVRDDYGSIKLFHINDKTTLNNLKRNEFVQQTFSNYIFRVDPKLIDSTKIKYIDDVQIFEDAAKNTKRTLNISNEYHFESSRPEVFVLYFMHFKTYHGFNDSIIHPFLLKESTSNYIHEYIEGRKLEIPVLPNSINEHQSSKDIFLFGTKSNTVPYDKQKGGKLGSKISRMFENLTGTSITINDLRHSYATYFKMKYAKDIEGEKESVIVSAAHRMFHSFDTHINSYTHNSNKIYSFPSTVYDKIKYVDNIHHFEKLVKKNKYKAKVFGLTGKSVNVIYHIQTSFDTKTTLIHNDMQGTVAWDERDTILCSVENDTDADDDDVIIEDEDNEILLGGGQRKSTQEPTNIQINPKNNGNTYTVFEELSSQAQSVSALEKQISNKEHQIRINFSNSSVPDLLTNTLNPFLIFDNKKTQSKLISFIGQEFTFPNYTNVIKNKYISKKSLLKIQVPLKLEIARLKRFTKAAQKNQPIYTHCPADLQHTVLNYNNNSVYAYDYLNVVEYPFVLEPKGIELRMRGSELFCRYLTIDDLTTFLKLYNKKQSV
jgi:hypothetical protein